MLTMRKPLFGTALALAALTVVAACSSSGGAPEQPANGPTNASTTNSTVNSSPSGSTKLTSIKIAVTHWPALVYAVPYEVGMEEGFFQKHGIKITGVVTSKGGGTTARAFLGGGLTFAEISTSAVVNAVNAGAKLVAVGAGVQSVGELIWIAKKDSPLNSIKDLPGHKVGFTTAGSVTQSVLSMSLESAGVDPTKVDRVATGGLSNGLTALADGGVDATVQSGPQFSAKANGDKMIFRASDYLKKFEQTVIVTSPDVVKKQPKLISNFLAARAEAIKYMKANPTQTAQIWSKKGGIALKAAQYAPKVLLPADEWGVGFNVDALNNSQKAMIDAGLLKKGQTVDWSKFVNQSFLPSTVAKITLP